MVLLVTVSFGILYFLPVPFAGASSAVLQHDGSWYALHIQGMWVALVTTGVFIAYFVTQVSAALQRREAELAAARELAARNERLVSLATLAAGAAHELGTPLATIAVTATELAHALEQARLTDTNAHEDVRLIRSQVERCRTIIEQIYVATTQAREESFVLLRLDDCLQNLRQELGPVLATRVRMSNECPALTVQCPRRALTHALMSLLRNALDATPLEKAVILTVKQREGCIHFQVHDTGCGMTPDVLIRAGDPFYTTKAPGQGMGLGLFLVRNLAERLGGRLELTSEPGKGTLAVLIVPLSSSQLGDAFSRTET
jgi:two-component system sensor histidine kinase RegB